MAGVSLSFSGIFIVKNEGFATNTNAIDKSDALAFYMLFAFVVVKLVLLLL